LAWIKGFGRLFQRTTRTAKKKNICPHHLVGKGSERQEASVCPAPLVQGNERMAGNSGINQVLYCLVKQVGLLGSTA